jgi:type I restriction enzyme S subunit
MTYPIVEIGTYCIPTEQRDPRLSAEQLFQYIDISSIDKDSKQITSTTQILGKDAPSRARKQVRHNDVLVSTVRPNLNAVAIVPKELDDEVASTGFCVLRPNPVALDSRFLFYWTMTKDFIEYLTGRVRGAHYPAVTDAVIKRAPLPLPLISEQRRIVEILDQAYALRRKRDDADATVTRILPALFLKMFGEPLTNSKKLHKEKLGELIKVRSGEFLPAKNMDIEGTYPVYGGNGINGYHSSYMFENPVIAIGRVGAYCGVVHYTAPRSWVTDNALYVSEKDEALTDEYLVAALRYANLNQYAGRAGQPLISGNRIYPIEILVPSSKEQEKFALLNQLIGTILFKTSDVSKKLNDLFSSLMRRAFSGELTSKWREAHMKALLAEMAATKKILETADSHTTLSLYLP